MIFDGAKLKIVITLDAELVTDINGVTEDELKGMILCDDSYGLKSIIVGKINPDCKDSHDTEILINQIDIGL